MTAATAAALAIGAWLVALTVNVALWAVARMAHAAFVLWVGRTIEAELAERVSKLEAKAKDTEDRLRGLEHARAAVSRR